MIDFDHNATLFESQYDKTRIEKPAEEYLEKLLEETQSIPPVLNEDKTEDYYAYKDIYHKYKDDLKKSFFSPEEKLDSDEEKNLANINKETTFCKKSNPYFSFN